MVKPPARSIHLLYVPTLCCNLACDYCYLGKQTTEAALKRDADRAVSTLTYALEQLQKANILAFNVSLHGGEVTTLPKPVLAQLFNLIRQHYLQHFDALNALGYKKQNPHIKTNLFRFESLFDFLSQHKVSISASIDLPLAMHAKHRVTRSGKNWLDRTKDNIRLLAKYPHPRKISATLCADHLKDIPAIIDDIWYIHRELGFDMNDFNIMFAFDSELSRAAHSHALTYATAAQQTQLYDALMAAFMGTELEDGLRRNWFDEFKPSYCTSSFNCGEKFYLLQSDGAVYSCVRGQGIDAFRYGNLFDHDIKTILDNGAKKIRAIHQEFGFDSACQGCQNLSTCHTGCPVVKYQQNTGRSYTCNLQKKLYADNPLSFPADRTPYTRRYANAMHTGVELNLPEEPQPLSILLPNDFVQEKNTLHWLIQQDPILQQLFDNQTFLLEIEDEIIPLESQLIKTKRTLHMFAAQDTLTLHIRKQIFKTNCSETLRNTLYIQLLRDTPVVYGDEQRQKQEHIVTYQIHTPSLTASERLGPDYLQFHITDFLRLHHTHFRHGISNNLFITTYYLRDYHYQKQKNNAFYHIQTANLPFQNVEFHYIQETLP